MPTFYCGNHPCRLIVFYEEGRLRQTLVAHCWECHTAAEKGMTLPCRRDTDREKVMNERRAEGATDED